MEPVTREQKAVKVNADPTTRPMSPVKNLPRAAGVTGGGQERLYGKPITEKALWRGES